MALAIALANYQLSLDVHEEEDSHSQHHPHHDVKELAGSNPKPVLALDLCASPSSSSASSECSTSSGTSTRSERPNEHLAVLLPKSLWKPDSLASACDNFHCRTPFTLLQRRHHCRKCGGVFCKDCTSRRLSLLDTTRLSFVHPPKNRPVSDFESPDSPVSDCRVCDDCWDLVWGRPRSPVPERRASASIMERSKSTGMLPSYTPSALSSCSSSPDSSILLTPSISPLSSRSRVRSLRADRRVSVASVPDEPSYGALDAYPLRRRSLICKATGGGRWEPRSSDLPFADYRLGLGGGRTPFEVEMDREEEERRKLKERGDVVVDGEFRYRFVCSPSKPLE